MLTFLTTNMLMGRVQPHLRRLHSRFNLMACTPSFRMFSNDFSDKNKKILTDYQAEFNRLRKQQQGGGKFRGKSDSSSGGNSSSGYSSNEGGQHPYMRRSTARNATASAPVKETSHVSPTEVFSLLSQLHTEPEDKGNQI